MGSGGCHGGGRGRGGPGRREGRAVQQGANPMKDDRWIWLNKEREWMRDDLMRTFLRWCMSGCMQWCGRS